VASRKSAQQVADDNLETAVRVHRQKTASLAKAKAAYDRAEEAEKIAGRKVKAARLVAGVDTDTPEDAQPEPEPETVPAAPPANEDLV
jgi:hypothetical protein